MADERRVLRRVLYAYQIVLKIEVPRLVEVKEIDKSHVHIIWSDSIYGVTPTSGVRARISVDHNGNLRSWYDVEVHYRLDPGEAVTIGPQERRCALVMAA